MLSFLPKKPNDVMNELKTKFKEKRKSLKYTQEQLSTKSDVSLGSLKRFENTGQISLESLLKLAFVLECLREFSDTCMKNDRMPKSLKEL